MLRQLQDSYRQLILPGQEEIEQVAGRYGNSPTE